ncbi:hypothetical protein HRG_013169 [Hirsutella rhossiliensis]
MGPPQIPPEHVYCVQAGQKHYDLFTTIYVGANYCGRCGLANPFGRSVGPGLKLRHFLAHMMRWSRSRTLRHGQSVQQVSCCVTD